MLGKGIPLILILLQSAAIAPCRSSAGEWTPRYITKFSTILPIDTVIVLQGIVRRALQIERTSRNDRAEQHPKIRIPALPHCGGFAIILWWAGNAPWNMQGCQQFGHRALSMARAVRRLWPVDPSSFNGGARTGSSSHVALMSFTWDLNSASETPWECATAIELS